MCWHIFVKLTNITFHGNMFCHSRIIISIKMKRDFNRISNHTKCCNHISYFLNLLNIYAYKCIMNFKLSKMPNLDQNYGLHQSLVKPFKSNSWESAYCKWNHNKHTHNEANRHWTYSYKTAIKLMCCVILCSWMQIRNIRIKVYNTIILTVYKTWFPTWREEPD